MRQAIESAWACSTIFRSVEVPFRSFDGLSSGFLLSISDFYPYVSPLNYQFYLKKRNIFKILVQIHRVYYLNKKKE